jgi:hypothetical protein
MAVVLDHLVVGARTLDEGVAWCEATLGITPGPGGRHALMGTHNRLVNLSSDTFPSSYLEIIAIDPVAPPPGRTRWYDLDDEALQAALADGPQLIHWVARSSNLQADLRALSSAGWDGGEAIHVERGELRWQISVRPDGRRLCGGVLPTLIQWESKHPCDDMPAGAVRLQSLKGEGLPESVMRALKPEGLDVQPKLPASRLKAVFSAGNGLVELASHPR